MLPLFLSTGREVSRGHASSLLVAHFLCFCSHSHLIISMFFCSRGLTATILLLIVMLNILGILVLLVGKRNQSVYGSD